MLFAEDKEDKDHPMTIFVVEAKAGITPGSKLISVCGHPVRKIEDVNEALRDCLPGATIEVEAKDANSEETVKRSIKAKSREEMQEMVVCATPLSELARIAGIKAKPSIHK